MDQQNLRVLFMTAILFFHASLPAPAIHFIFLVTKGCLVLGHSSPRRPLQYFIIHSWQDKLTRKQWRERETGVPALAGEKSAGGRDNAC
jgi:hypothetical protein